MSYFYLSKNTQMPVIQMKKVYISWIKNFYLRTVLIPRTPQSTSNLQEKPLALKREH
jgi:hypothetical protein